MKLSDLFPPLLFEQTRTAATALIRKASQRSCSLADDLIHKIKTARIFKLNNMTGILLILSFVTLGVISAAGALRNVSHPLPPSTKIYSTDMAMSIIARQQGLMNSTKEAGLALQAGITQKAMIAWSAQYGGHPLIYKYIIDSADATAAFMADTIDDLKLWPLDRLSAGNALFLSDGGAYDLTLGALRDSIRLNRRNDENGLWYWESYPQWSYLDGMYSLGPFAVLDALSTVNGANGSNASNAEAKIDPDTAALQDMHLQFQLLWEHCYNSTTGLLVHGYDASRTAVWADARNGASGIVWGRSLGWFMMALIDTMELLGTGPQAAVWSEPLLAMYQRLAGVVMTFADERTGCWYQVVDQAGREGNYIESSASAMFSYALLKGARLGYLSTFDVPRAQKAGRVAHDFIAREFVIIEEDGTLGWNGTVGVCSLNSTASYDYYIEQPIAYNSVLGASAFIMSSLEVEHLDSARLTPQGGATRQGVRVR
ncbi:hypothetical protein N8I77_012079 [Diaporthe amygdali]|uniref:Uncharacterized protein n=1 Tax=Phomopsis amygdali TaxID=1214568 RepID=A0AAD9S419_PHOAM|nr:hypothetical protein N8I77_012079 [Diaporthe amygdali]